MAYRFLENIAKADTAFEVTAESLGELFRDAGRALFSVMVNLQDVVKKESIAMELKNTKIDLLLYEWLSELVYEKDVKQLLFSDFQVYVEESEGTYKLRSTAYGEKIDPKKHDLSVDVKAITYHMFTVEQRDGKWYARVVIDV